MAALILAHTEKHPDDLATAVEHALCSTQRILLATVEAAGPAATASERTAEVWVTSCKPLIRDPDLDLIPLSRHSKIGSCHHSRVVCFIKAGGEPSNWGTSLVPNSTSLRLAAVCAGEQSQGAAPH